MRVDGCVGEWVDVWMIILQANQTIQLPHRLLCRLEMRTRARANMCVCVRARAPRACVCMRAHGYVYRWVYLCARVYVRVRACMRACVCERESSVLWVFARAHTHTYILSVLLSTLWYMSGVVKLFLSD